MKIGHVNRYVDCSVLDLNIFYDNCVLQQGHGDFILYKVLYPHFEFFISQHTTSYNGWYVKGNAFKPAESVWYISVPILAALRGPNFTCKHFFHQGSHA